MTSNAPAAPGDPTVPDSFFNGATRLADWGLIRARGEEAGSFLQGQLTNDVARLPAGQARLAGYCSPKGRLLASFVVWRTADGPEGDFLLACSADVLPATLKRLSMFVMRARCKLSDASSELALWGCAGTTARAALGSDAPIEPWQVLESAGAQWVRLPDALGQPRFLWCAPTDASGVQAPAGLAALAPSAWRWLEVHSGVVRIVAATVEQFVPQMINFELVGGVDFKKGCYPGQEVVARSQYRGTLKRRAVLLTSAVPLAEGQEVFHDADPGQPAGTVALAASLGSEGTGQSAALSAAQSAALSAELSAPSGAEGAALGHAALVELKRASLLGGSLHLGSAEGALLLPGTLPYDMPSDDA